MPPCCTWQDARLGLSAKRRTRSTFANSVAIRMLTTKAQIAAVKDARLGLRVKKSTRTTFANFVAMRMLTIRAHGARRGATDARLGRIARNNTESICVGYVAILMQTIAVTFARRATRPNCTMAPPPSGSNLSRTMVSERVPAVASEAGCMRRPAGRPPRALHVITARRPHIRQS